MNYEVELLELIESQSVVINKQQEIISKLMDSCAEKENLITFLNLEGGD